MQTTVEELKLANKESNTAKEELQSTNEELLTVNMEFRYKTEELTECNNDIANLLQASQLATIFLGDHLQTNALPRLYRNRKSGANRY